VFVAAGLIDGTLINNLLEREVAAVAATLKDFRRVDLADSGWAVLEPSPGEAVVGFVVLDLGSEDLARIDAYRGVREGLYRRTSASAWLDGRQAAEPVFIYLPTERTLRRLFGR
jgi:hypothetical protein